MHVQTAVFNEIFRYHAIFEHCTSVCGWLYARQPKFLVAFLMYHNSLYKYLIARLEISDLHNQKLSLERIS